MTSLNQETSKNMMDYKTPPDPFSPKKDSHEKLLQKQNLPRYSFEYELKQNQRKPSLIVNKNNELFDNNLQQSDYCYPKFLSCIGDTCIPCKILFPCCFCGCCCCSTQPLFKQQTQSLGLLQNWGRFQKILQPGLHVVNPVSQSIIEVNQQTKILQYSQIGISRDNVQFKLTIVLFYRILDSLRLSYRLGNYDIVECIKQIATGTLRCVLGENVLQTIIQNRQLITHKFTEDINRILDYWGIYVEICSIKQLLLDEDVQKALQSLTQTKRLSEAMLINFRAQVQCGKLIKQISQIIDNEASFQMRYLNTNGNQNIVFIKTSMRDQTNHSKNIANQSI